MFPATQTHAALIKLPLCQDFQATEAQRYISVQRALKWDDMVCLDFEMSGNSALSKWCYLL